MIAIENDGEYRKQNFSIPPMTRVIVYQTLQAEKLKKKKKKKKKKKNRFSLAVIAIENDDECRKQNFSIPPITRVIVYQTLSAEKIEKKFC